jgi:hypothetical protein
MLRATRNQPQRLLELNGAETMRIISLEKVLSCLRTGFLVFLGWIFLLAPAAGAASEKEDYLTAAEINKLREEFGEPSPRFKLLERFLKRRFDHARALKADLVPLSAAAQSGLAEEEKGKKAKKVKKKKEPEEVDEEGPVDTPENEAAKTFVEWIQEYSQCLEDIESNLQDLPGVQVDVKGMLKALKSLDKTLDDQHQWISQVSPKVKGSEKKLVVAAAEVLADVSPVVEAYIDKYEAEQKLLKQQNK